MARKIYLLSPLKATLWESEQIYDDGVDIDYGYELLEYQTSIKQALEESKRYRDNELMQYYDKQDSVKEKVKSLEVTVVEKDGELKGCAVAEIVAPLNQKEIGILKGYLRGQYSDGWGEGFEQEDIPVENGRLNVHFCCMTDFEVLYELEKPGAEKHPFRPKMRLIGMDGNIFSILGQAARLLKDNEMPQEADEMQMRVEQCGNYYKALGIISEYVETELSDVKLRSGRQGKKNVQQER